MSEPRGKTPPLLAMVAVNSPSPPPPDALLASVEELSGTTIDRASVLCKSGSMAFPLERNAAGVGLMPKPIPWKDLEGPCATAWWWPEATEAMKTHSGHVLVFLAGESGGTIQRHLALTQLAAAVAAHTDAAGVYWGSGALVHEPQAFIEEARKASRENLPLPLWIDFRVEENDNGSHRMFTTGLQAFGKYEIEIPQSEKGPAEIIDFACSIAHYLLASDKIIEEGHTVGRSAREKIVVHHGPSMWNERLTVLRLDF
jgi:hypothetical protein